MDQPNPQMDETDSQKALLDALLGNDFDTFCELLESGQVDPSYRYGKPHYSTCLEIASGNPELPAGFINKLLECGVKPNVCVVIPEPIHYAARSGNTAALRLLLSNPATRVNAVNSSGYTALHYIVMAFKDDVSAKNVSRYESCIESLIECPRFDINAVDNYGLSALHLAANKKRHKAAATIIDKSRAAHRDLDMDRYMAGGRTAREALEAELPDVCLRRVSNGGSIPASKKRLLQAMDLGNFPLYQRLLRRAAMKDDFDVDFWFDKPYSTRLLERACSLDDDYLAGKFVKATLDAGAHPSSVNLCSQSTPLHAATAAGNFSALKLLLEHPLVDVNVKNSNGQTPLHIAASCASSQNKQDCLQLLLNAEHVDVNAKDAFGKTPADLAGCHDALTMIKHKGGEVSLETLPPLPPFIPAPMMRFGGVIPPAPPPPANCVLLDGQKMCHHRTIPLSPLKDGAEKKRLFDMMKNKQYTEFEELFEKIACDEKSLVCNECGYTFLQYACERGLHDFAKKLVEKMDPNETHEKNRKTPLMLACIQNDKEMVHILLNTISVKEIDVNAVDQKQNTALHYAAKDEDMDIVMELLSHGANILAKNMFGKYPLSVEEMEKLLDKSINARENIMPSNDDFAIIFRYKMLISQCTLETNSREDKGQLVESRPSKTESTKGNAVLLGPRSQVAYSEMKFLNSISTSPDYTPLLKHPLISSFLRLKDDRMRSFLSVNLVFCIVFVITLNAYIVIEVGKLYDYSPWVHSLQMCFCAAAFLCSVFMLFREVAQLVLKTNLYFENPENIFDVCLILVAMLILLQCPLEPFYNWAFTAAILLSWRDLFIVTGRHYRFSTNVQMLKAVSLNYLQFLKSYIYIILAFSLSFYVIFSQSNNQTMRLSNNSQDDNRTDILNENKTADGGTETSGEVTNTVDFFENPLKTLLKSVVMMTGEFEASNLPFMTDIWLSSIVFILFLFFLHVVLLNLLTALAVSDEQQIRGNAEILSLMSQVKLLYEVENIILSLYKLFKPCRCIAKWLQNLLLFPEKSLEEASLVIWPNKGTQGRISGEEGELIKQFDSKIVNDAKSIATGHSDLSMENICDMDNFAALIQRFEHIESNIHMLLEQQHVRNSQHD